MERGTGGKMGVPARAPPPSSNSSSSLAMVVDKRPPHRPGGCVGIFFQLFDWNRRLTNGKFFSGKLLPQVRAAKKISKKFAGEERMPAARLLLIADENRGGFPSTKRAEAGGGAARASAIRSGREKGMCTPGLVARLMGLETMPATVRQDGPRKAVDGAAAASSDSGCCFFDGSDTSGSFRRYQDLGLEAGGGSGAAKLDRRPPKLQKTGFFDRRPVTAAARGGTEALLFNKAVLARPRKRHHKLASPVKSPRLPGRRSSARLMEAAARILEPGLQDRNRARCSLTYTAAPLQSRVEEDGTSPPSQRPAEPPGAPAVVGPCKNCGNLVQVPDLVLKPDEPSAERGSSSSSSSSSSSEFSNTSSSHCGFPETASKVPRLPSLLLQPKPNAQSRPQGLMARKPLLQNEARETRNPRRAAGALGSGVKQSCVRPNEAILVRRERVAPAPKTGTRQQPARGEPRSESRDFVAMNRNPNSCCSRTRPVSRATDCQNAWGKRPLVRKRRPVGDDTQIEGAAATNSTSSKQRAGVTSSEVRDEKGAKQTSGRPIRGNSQKLGTGDCGSGNKNSGAASFRFSTPTRSDGVLSASVSEKSKAGRIHGGLPLPAPDAGKKVDSLSALLEEKIRELSRLNQDESAAGDEARSRSTAAILEELIVALTAARPMPQKECDDSPVDVRLGGEACDDSRDPPKCSHFPKPKLSVIQDFQAEEKSKASPGDLNSSDYDQPSPVSILQASFSNDSCLSENFNSSSGRQPQIGFTDISFGNLKPWHLDADLSDSATSTQFRTIEAGREPLRLDSILIMSNTDSHGNGSTGHKHNYVREIIANAELIFESTYPEEPGGKIYSSIDFILFDTLETLFCAFWETRDSSPDFSVTEEVKLRRFLFDCIVEHLDVKYSYRCKIGYNPWVKQPPITRDKLAQQICKEIRNCRDVCGKTLDEIVEKHMIYINEKWTDFEIEACEVSVQIGNDLLQLLMDETVLDLLQC